MRDCERHPHPQHGGDQGGAELGEDGVKCVVGDEEAGDLANRNGPGASDGPERSVHHRLLEGAHDAPVLNVVFVACHVVVKLQDKGTKN